MNKIVKFVNNTRNISKLDMLHNSYLPNIEVNPETWVLSLSALMTLNKLNKLEER